MRRTGKRNTVDAWICIVLVLLLAVSLLCSASIWEQGNQQKQQIATLELQVTSLQDEAASLQDEATVLQEQVSHYESLEHGVRRHGALQVVGGQLTDQDGQPVQLRGMSTHGLLWYPQYTNASAADTVYEYGGNVMRIALYSDQGGGYIYQPEQARDALLMAIENYLSSDMYVIVDWHILQDNDPNTHSDAAAELFETVTSLYGNHPAILYEICNEPNGNTSWEDIRGYAEKVIPIIRRNAPDSIILVGTPNHSTNLSGPLQNPLSYKNVMYSYHQYTATMDENYGKVLDKAAAAQLPVFVSEWGVSEKSGDGEVALATAQEFVDYLNQNNISWVNWSLSNKDESSAALLPQTNRLSGWSLDELTASGQLAFRNLRRAQD